MVSCDNPPILRHHSFRRLYASALGLALILAAFHPARAQQSDRPVAVIGIPGEIDSVESRIQNASATSLQGFVFTSGTIDGIRVVAARAGIGKVNASIAATLLLERFTPSAVILTGTAGALDNGLNPGDVVIATAAGYHDVGTLTGRGIRRAPTRDPKSGQADPLFFPANPALLAAARAAAKVVQPARGPRTTGDSPKVREGLIVTGDSMVSDGDLSKSLRKDLNAIAVEAEGAAVAQVCARYDVPALVLRGITDRADSQARGSYRQFLEVAARNAADLAIATIRELARKP